MMSATNAKKSTKDRTTPNATEVIVLIPADLLAHLDDWIDAQVDKPSRSEAVLRILLDQVKP